MKKLILTVSILTASLMFLNAGENWYSIGETVTFKSKVLNEDRSIIVYTPETYNLSGRNYPVMYLLDGGAHFHHVSGIVQFLAGNGIIPEMIVVAVQNVDRTRDFSPTPIKKKPTTGGAKKFMSFLSDELIPFVDRNYKTLPYEILVGHSFGGEFAAYALLTRPDVFNAYIAISPYMMYDNGYIVKETETKLKPKYKNEIQFYMTIGNEPAYFATLGEFKKIIENKSPEGLEFTYVKMDNEDHGSVPHLSVYRGLESIYQGWKVTNEIFINGLAAIDGHYEKLSSKYGYQIPTPEYTVNKLGYYYLNKKEMSTAIKTFKENASRFPNSANVYDSLGEALENDNYINEAAKNYEKAVALATNSKHPNLKIYKKNLERVQQKLAQN